MDESSTPVIKKSWLLGVYSIVPLVALVVLFDSFILNNAWQPYLTTSALLFPLYILFFEMPHIVASLNSFADKEYINYYKTHLFKILPLVLILFAIIFYKSLVIGILIYAIYTMYHFVRQQTGIALTMTKRRDWVHEAWTFSGVFASALGFLIIFATQMIPLPYVMFASLALVPASLLFVVISVYVVWRTYKGMARWYVASVSISIVASYVLLLLNYLFLALFVLRFIHDVTAFIFYIVHDRKRNALVRHNFMYRITGSFGIPVLLATPLLAVIIGYILRSELMVFQVGVVIIMMIGIMHYYLEGVMWKRESIHRQQLSFE